LVVRLFAAWTSLRRRAFTTLLRYYEGRQRQHCDKNSKHFAHVFLRNTHKVKQPIDANVARCST